MRKVFLGIVLFFIITLLFSDTPLSAQTPSCTITVSSTTGFANVTKFEASGTTNIQLDPKQSRIDIVDETRTTVIRSIGFSTLNKDSFSIDEFGPFLKEGKYHLNLLAPGSRRGPVLLCLSSTIDIIPSLNPIPPPTCNPPGRNPKNFSVCADPNCHTIAPFRNATVNSPCEPFGIVVPTPTPTEPPSPLPQCAQWANLQGTPIPIQQTENRKNIKCIAVDTAIGTISTEPAKFIQRIFSLVLGIAGGIALILIMISGYKFMASQGNPEALKAAQEQLVSAIIGLLFIIFSFVILQVIGVDILKIPGFNP